MAASSFTGPGRKLVTADPTFEALGAYSRAAGAEVVKVPLTATWGHDLARMMTAAGEKGLVYVCNPNNLTATITPKGEISELLSRAPAGVTILVDEAYHHYAGSPDYQTFIPAVADHRI